MTKGARRKVPNDVRAAIERHFKQLHEDVGPRIGREHSSKAACDVTWWPSAGEEAASFSCRLCPNGRNRYSIEVDAPEPSERMLELIREHFADVHAEEVRLEDIVGLRERNDRDAVVWVPARASSGAHFLCRRCRPESRVPAHPRPPFGDARRLTHLEQRYPEMRREITGLSPNEYAEYFEYFDRGQLPDERQKKARRRLGTARQKAAAARPRLLEAPLRRHLRRRVLEGEKISRVITELETLARENPIGFSCLIARELDLADPDEPDSERLAEKAKVFLNEPRAMPLSIAKSTLWKYWAKEQKDWT